MSEPAGPGGGAGADAGYAFLSVRPGARRRVRLLERLQDPATRRRLAALGVTLGWRCLEVGAGGGSIARWLCERVGPDGAVLATDIDLALLVGPRPPNLEVLRHDLRREPLPQGGFDLVHARWVLHHLPEPDRVARSLAAALRPGGILLLEELDRFPVQASPSRSYAALSDACTRAAEAASGGSYEWARGLPGLIPALGLEAAGAEVDVPTVVGSDPRAELLRLTFLQVRDAVVAAGGLDAAGFDDALAELGRPGFLGYSAATVAAWGRRPPSGAPSRPSRPGAGPVI